MTKRSAQPSAPSQRALRVGELIRHALADLLTRGEVHDPVLEDHLITVPEVRMSADLRLATIYVMPLGGRNEEDVLDALERNKRYMRGEIARRVNLKFAPEIRFRIDDAEEFEIFPVTHRVIERRSSRRFREPTRGRTHREERGKQSGLRPARRQGV